MIFFFGGGGGGGEHAGSRHNGSRCVGAFETLNLHARESTLEKIVPQGLIRNTNTII